MKVKSVTIDLDGTLLDTDADLATAANGMLRTGVEDTFYLPDGGRAAGNGALIEALVTCARKAGREVASPAKARAALDLAAA